MSDKDAKLSYDTTNWNLNNLSYVLLSSFPKPKLWSYWAIVRMQARFFYSSFFNTLFFGLWSWPDISMVIPCLGIFWLIRTFSWNDRSCDQYLHVWFPSQVISCIWIHCLVNICFSVAVYSILCFIDGSPVWNARILGTLWLKAGFNWQFMLRKGLLAN